MTDIRHCGICTGNFELVPPADSLHTLPRLKPIEDDDDYILMVYECDIDGCHNKVYWYKKAGPVVVSASYPTFLDEIEKPRYSSVIR